MSGADADGDATLRLHRNDARQAREGEARGIGTRLDKAMVTSCRSAIQNCVSINRSIASEKTKPIMRIATAKPIPTIDAEARSGWRVTLRSTMRPAAPRRRATQGVSSIERR